MSGRRCGIRSPLGVILGLFFGKQLGVGAACWAVVRLGFATLPSRATWRQVHGVALLCRIGFTMSLFIATLAFDAGGLEQAKIGVLAGSLVSGVAGYLVLAGPRRRALEESPTDVISMCCGALERG